MCRITFQPEIKYDIMAIPNSYTIKYDKVEIPNRHTIRCIIMTIPNSHTIKFNMIIQNSDTIKCKYDNPK